MSAPPDRPTPDLFAAPGATGGGGWPHPWPDNRLDRLLREHLLQVPRAWLAPMTAFADSEAGMRLCAQVDARRAAGAEIYPSRPLRALPEGGAAAVRVVILGQDPYHGPGEAEGLAFSVPEGVRRPPSLRNIHQELADDLGLPAPQHGSLAPWVAQGVLLLNTTLTVERDRPASHAKLGWSGLTDALIDAVAADPAPKVFLLWGAHAQQKAERVRLAGRAHAVVMSNHPSPLSARRPPLPFLGSQPFSRANDLLRERGADPVDWSLSTGRLR